MSRKFTVSSSTRARCFSLTTYLTSTDILKCIFNHSNQIRIYAFAHHDKDVYTDEDRAGEIKEPHTHILLITYSNTTASAVRRWFYGFVDKDGEQINTLAQVCKDKYAYYDYLTHSDPKSRADGKYRYPDEIIQSNDYEYFKGHSKAELDSANLIIDAMLCGTDYDTLRRRFGRDFILNFDKYKFFCKEQLTYGFFNEKFEAYVNEHIRQEFIEKLNS